MPIPDEADAPLLITARLDATSFKRLDDLRTRWFPPALNRVPAHLSLFHHLPGHETRAVLDAMRAVCAEHAALRLTPMAPRLLGRGVALAYGCDELGTIRTRLAARFAGWLTPQDRQPFKAHVTIQNKVTPAEARDLFARLQEMPPIAAIVEGLDLWRYLGGPWEPVATVPLDPA